MIDLELETRLVADLRKGDPIARKAALGQLFEHLGRPLLQVCLRVAGNRTAAEDALQETFVDVLRALPTFRGEARFSTWIFRIAIRAATRVRNRRGREDERGLSTPELVELDQLHASVTGRPEVEPSSIAEQRESAARLLAAIASLPAPQRAVLGLAAVAGLAQTEIAAILGIPVGTVYSRLSAAREQLRAALER